MYAFQIFETVYSNDKVIDVDNVLWILPICMVVIPFVYFIRLKLFDKYVHGIDLEAMNAELQYYKSKEREELKKAGVSIDSLTHDDHEINRPNEVNKDLSNETPKRTLNEIMQQLQQAMKSILSL